MIFPSLPAAVAAIGVTIMQTTKRETSIIIVEALSMFDQQINLLVIYQEFKNVAVLFTHDDITLILQPTHYGLYHPLYIQSIPLYIQSERV